ncbi:HAD family hydrolase [Sphingopyxis yananensis]|uniref:hypothetical protein n=1 Tax=Sphingopyxis yananensis TaxID=2886687 RepID=UPI001D12100F|nr:hypothetical protein [Sphingopyxis yananensis]MCC2602212.1 hypothetical protein [Sphingopyxis yananensis]
MSQHLGVHQSGALHGNSHDRRAPSSGRWGHILGSGDARYILCVCFLAGLLAGAAMLMDGWAHGFWIKAAGALALSILLSVMVLNGVIWAVFRRRVAGFSAQWVGGAMRNLSGADLLLIDDPMVLRRSGRCLAAQQPRLDPRLAPVMLGLAKHGDHPLTIALANSLEGSGVAEEMISKLDVQSSGHLRGEWRGHDIILFVQPIGYGHTKLVIHLHMDGEPAASAVFDEDIRSDAPPMLRALRRAGVVPVLYAPDSAQMLGPMARQLGLMAQGFMSAPDKDAAIARHCAAGHVPLILSLAAGRGAWMLRSGGTGRALLMGQDMAAIPAAILWARDLRALKHHGMRILGITHLGALAMMMSGWTMPIIAALTWGIGAGAMWWIWSQHIHGPDKPAAADRLKKRAAI